MSIKLAQVERALVTDNMLQHAKPHLDRRQRAVIALRLEYFERMAVRLQYHKNDLVNNGCDVGTLKKFCTMASDVLLLASLWRPFQHWDMGDGTWAVRGIDAFLGLYDAVVRLLVNDLEAAAACLDEVKGMHKPYGFGSSPYGGYDEYVKAIMEES